MITYPKYQKIIPSKLWSRLNTQMDSPTTGDQT